MKGKGVLIGKFEINHTLPYSFMNPTSYYLCYRSYESCATHSEASHMCYWQGSDNRASEANTSFINAYMIKFARGLLR